MDSLILLLNNHFETKFKGWDTTQSTPQKKKTRYLVYWYSGTCSFKMTGQGSWNEPTSPRSSEKRHFKPHDFIIIIIIIIIIILFI